MKRSLDVQIPLKAISTNKLYGGVKRRSWYYKKYRKDIFAFLNDNYKEPISLKGNLVLTMEVGFSSVLCDVSNSIKGVEDCIAEYFGFNDRQIVTIIVSKYIVNKGEEYTRIALKCTKKDIDRRVKYGKRKKEGKR